MGAIWSYFCKSNEDKKAQPETTTEEGSKEKDKLNGLTVESGKADEDVPEIPNTKLEVMEEKPTDNDKIPTTPKKSNQVDERLPSFISPSKTAKIVDDRVPSFFSPKKPTAAPMITVQ